ncbi:MAG: TolC family protein [Desulfuromonadaceae bacterium]
MYLLILLLLSMLILPVTAFSAENPTALSLTDAIRMAVEKNLDVRAELYNSAAYEADIKRNRAIYDPLFTALTNYTDSTIPSVNVGTPVSLAGKSFELNAGLSQLLWTGATVSAGFNNSHSSTNKDSYDYWQSSLGVSIVQPLLKNVGREATEVNINVSRLNKFASLEHFNVRLLSTVAQVRTEYYKLHSLREERDVKKISLDLARKILSDTEARVKAGVLPAMEILNAEFGAVSREKELIDAERAVSDQVDVLRLLLQMNAETVDLKTVDLPPRDLLDVNESDSIQKALNRPDIREQKRNLELYELQTKNFSQKTRPDLILSASTQSAGLNNAYHRNMDSVLSIDNPGWSVGLEFKYPLGNGVAVNDYRRSRLKTEQTSLLVRSLEESSTKEVKAAIRGIAVGFKQIDVADRGAKFAEERLRAFIRKNEVGLATTKDVLDVENDLAIARSNQIKAVVGYANALTTYWQVTGELLEKEGIRVVEGDADKLYSAVK